MGPGGATEALQFLVLQWLCKRRKGIPGHTSRTEPEPMTLPKRDIPALIEALRVRAMALTGAQWERAATADMMREAAECLEDAEGQRLIYEEGLRLWDAREQELKQRLHEANMATVAERAERDNRVVEMSNRIDRLRAALAKITARHDWQPGLGMCVCESHIEARKLLGEGY